MVGQPFCMQQIRELEVDAVKAVHVSSKASIRPNLRCDQAYEAVASHGEGLYT